MVLFVLARCCQPKCSEPRAISHCGVVIAAYFWGCDRQHQPEYSELASLIFGVPLIPPVMCIALD